MSDDYSVWRREAEQGFERAHRQALFECILGRITGRPTNLLRFEEAKEKLGLLPSRERGLCEIPMERIVGTVGRYREFTRSFLPRDLSLKDRWKQIYVLALGFRGLPPIQVYRVGDVYFVQDGNIRVSVARQMGATTIEAYVIEFASRVPLSTAIRLRGVAFLAVPDSIAGR